MATQERSLEESARLQRLGAYLQQQREIHHPDWRPAEIARRAGVSGSTISRLEGGQTQRPPFELLGRVAPWYGVSTIDLWERAGHIQGQDAASLAAALAELAPVELVRMGLERGPWPREIVQAVKLLLERETMTPPW